MSELDLMLDPPGETLLPPLVRNLKARQEAGDRIEVELDRGDAVGSISRTVLLIRRWEGEDEQPSQEVEWDNGINNDLIDLGIRAVDSPQEATRFCLVLRTALSRVERQYGSGYLNMVLVALIDESDLGKSKDIARIRRKHITIEPPESGRVYQDCREQIASEFGGRAVELRDKLGYKPKQVKTILAQALAIYLDERFSVSTRRYYGMI